MWGFLQDAEVSLDSINRGLMLPMSRENWVLKEAPCIIGSPVKNDDRERTAVAAHFIANREACQGSSRPQSRQSLRPRSRPSSTQGCRKPKRTASLSELKESASNRAATWLRNYAAYEQSELLQVALTLDGQRNSLQRMSSAPETLRPSSATNRGHDRRGKVTGAGTNGLQRREYGRLLRKQCPGLRCDTGEERLVRKEERSGWPAPWADAVPPSPGDVGARPSTTPSRTREKKSEAKGATTGLVRAVECDKRFQSQLLESWRRTNNLEAASERVHRRQVCQFFDFLRKPDGDMNMDSGVVPYIEEGFASAEFVEGEMARAAPEIHGKDMPAAGGELSTSKKTAIRQVLVLYSQVARPQNPGVHQEVIFRASFCRFILDSNLVSIEAEDTERPTYHKSVRLFDNISKFGSGGLARFANIDHCVTLVIQLMMQINMPAALAWELFEEGLQKAERTAEVLARETQKKVKDCQEVLAMDITEEAILERRMDMFGKHGSPPQLFQGPLAVWTRGLRFWINNITDSCMPENTADRIEQIVAHNQYIRDEIVEPGCLYILMKFHGLFEELFNAYCYEEKTAVKEDENGKIRNEPVSHMSFAAFFRFCLDFSVFPSLVAFEEAWQAYCKADCVQLLGTKERPVKVKQFKKAEAPSRVSAILGLRSIVNRNRKGKERESIEFDKKTETSASDQEEEEEEEQSSETESSEDEEEEEMLQIIAPRARGTTGEVISGESSRQGSRAGSGDASTQPHMRSSGHKNTLLLPVSPQRPRRGVNDEEVAAALRNHRRQSIGPGDSEATQAQIAVQQSPEKMEVQLPEIQPEAETKPVPSPKSASRSPSASGPAGARQSPRGSPRGSPRLASKNAKESKESKEGEKAEQDENHIKVPRRASGEPRPSTGNRFLSVLGALDPSKVKDLDLGSAREKENAPKKVLPRVKVTASFSWLQKPFREMTDKELKGYSLLISLDECCRDHFLNVRGLVLVGKIQRSRQGFLSYIAFMELLKKFRITHGFETSSQLQEFMQVIDPCSGGQLDPVELEKAINAVREDEARRRPNAEPRGGPWSQTLGEEARRLSSEPLEVDSSGNEVPVAFNLPAFVETLLLLGHLHMQGSGAFVKCCAASAAKATYVVNFLHHQHDRLVKLHNEQRKKATMSAAEQAATVLVRPRSPPPAAETKKEDPSKLTGSMALNKMVGAARKVLRDAKDTKEERLHHRNAVVTAVVDVVPTQAAELPKSPATQQSSKTDEGGPLIPPSPSSRGQRTDSARTTAQQEHWPDTAAYTSVADVLTKSNQDIFKRWMEGEGKLPQLSPWFSDSNKICSKCKRQRDSQGIGNVFCHVCSCVDAKPLNETLLYPAMDRARLRRKMGSKTIEQPVTRNHRASSQLSGSGASN